MGNKKGICEALVPPKSLSMECMCCLCVAVIYTR